MKAETSWKTMEKYGKKAKILLTQIIMMKNAWKWNSIQITIFLWKKKIELYDIVIVVRFVFNDGNKYYPQVFLDECLYKLAVLDINVRVW